MIPIHNVFYTISTIFLTFWAAYVHENIGFTSNEFMMGSEHHSIHHDEGRAKNYGQFFTIWDRLGGTYLSPNKIINKK
jgi:Delta7-sterol 5-desaturase